MPNSPEQHVKMLIGDLVFKLAVQAAELEALREQAEKPAVVKPESA
jgi:hypothetical protein